MVWMYRDCCVLDTGLIFKSIKGDHMVLDSKYFGNHNKHYKGLQHQFPVKEKIKCLTRGFYFEIVCVSPDFKHDRKPPFVWMS